MRCTQVICNSVAVGFGRWVCLVLFLGEMAGDAVGPGSVSKRVLRIDRANRGRNGGAAPAGMVLCGVARLKEYIVAQDEAVEGSALILPADMREQHGRA